jgi:ribonuclease P protein component
VKGSFRFTQKERIALPQDFRRAMKSGRRLTSKHYFLFLQENEKGFHRLGMIVKKEIGPANIRNRMKRYLREFFRLNKNQIKGSFDIIILVKKGVLPKCYREVEDELRKVLV